MTEGKGLTKILVAMSHLLGCIDDVGLKRDRQFNHVDNLTLPHDNVRLQVSDGNVLGKVVLLPWQVVSGPHFIRQVSSKLYLVQFLFLGNIVHLLRY